jgi:hypothetical protein
LNKKRLATLLQQFGEYPAKYRLVIWSFLLELPGNWQAFQVGQVIWSYLTLKIKELPGNWQQGCKELETAVGMLAAWLGMLIVLMEGMLAAVWGC